VASNSPERLKEMRDYLERLKAQGIGAIDGVIQRPNSRDGKQDATNCTPVPQRDSKTCFKNHSEDRWTRNRTGLIIGDKNCFELSSVCGRRRWRIL
jgi:hypothetical protein